MAFSFSDWFFPTALSAGITNSETVIQVDTLTAEFASDVRAASGKHPLRIGRDGNQERVLVTGVNDEANNKLDVERGAGPFGAQSHNTGARVIHPLPARNAQETLSAPLDRSSLAQEIQALRAAVKSLDENLQWKTVTASGDNSQQTFQLPHGLPAAPEAASVQAETAAAAGEFWISDRTASYVEITYQNAPGSGTDNLTWSLFAATNE